MYTMPFLLRVLGLLWLVLGLLGLLSVCSLEAQLHFATNSERPNFARFCAFRLVNLAEGPSSLRRRREILLFLRSPSKIVTVKWTKETPD